MRISARIGIGLLAVLEGYLIFVPHTAKLGEDHFSRTNTSAELILLWIGKSKIDLTTTPGTCSRLLFVRRFACAFECYCDCCALEKNVWNEHSGLSAKS